MKSISFLLGIIVLGLSCKKDSFPHEKDIPIVRMMKVENISQEGVLLKAEIVSLGSYTIVEAGFEWFFDNGQDYFEAAQDRFFLPVDINGNNIVEAFLDRDLSPYLDYQVRFVIRAEEERVRSNIVTFASQGSKFSPWKEIPLDDLMHSEDAITFYNENVYIQTGDNFDLWKFNYETDSWEGLFSSNLSPHSPVRISFYHNGKGYYFKNSGLWAVNYDTGARSEIQENINAIYKFVIGDYLYYGNSQYLYKFDLVQYTVEQLITHPASQTLYESIGSFSVGNKGYITAISKNSKTSFLWIYDPISNTWENGAPYPGSSNKNYKILDIGDRAFMGISNGHTEELWEYHDTKGWIFVSFTPVRSTNLMVNGNPVTEKVYFFERGSQYKRFYEFTPSSIVDIE